MKKESPLSGAEARESSVISPEVAEKKSDQLLTRMKDRLTSFFSKKSPTETAKAKQSLLERLSGQKELRILLALIILAPNVLRSLRTEAAPPPIDRGAATDTMSGDQIPESEYFTASGDFDVNADTDRAWAPKFEDQDKVDTGIIIDNINKKITEMSGGDEVVGVKVEVEGHRDPTVTLRGGKETQKSIEANQKLAEQTAQKVAQTIEENTDQIKAPEVSVSGIEGTTDVIMKGADGQETTMSREQAINDLIQKTGAKDIIELYSWIKAFNRGNHDRIPEKARKVIKDVLPGMRMARIKITVTTKKDIPDNAPASGNTEYQEVSNQGDLHRNVEEWLFRPIYDRKEPDPIQEEEPEGEPWDDDFPPGPIYVDPPIEPKPETTPPPTSPEGPTPETETPPIDPKEPKTKGKTRPPIIITDPPGIDDPTIVDPPIVDPPPPPPPPMQFKRGEKYPGYIEPKGRVDVKARPNIPRDTSAGKGRVQHRAPSKAKGSRYINR